MNKIFSKRPYLIKIVSVILIGVAILSLSSCSNTYSRFPQVESNNETYISLKDDNGNVVSINNEEMKVTKGEVWNELRYSAKSILTNKIDEVAYAKNLEDVKTNTSKYASDLELLAIKGIYSVDDKEALADMDADAKELAVKKWADVTYTGTKETVDTSKFADGDYSAAYKYYYDALAKKLFALGKLEEEIKDSDDPDNYFSNGEILTYYNNNYKYTGYDPVEVDGKKPGDIEAIVVRFVSSDEAAQTLKAFGIKEYSGDLCFIKPESSTQTTSEYSTYYDDFSFTKDSNKDAYVQLGTLKNGDAAVLQLYIEMYNYIYTYRTALENSDAVAQVTTKNRTSVTSSIIEQYGNTATDIPTVESLYESYLKTSADFKTYVQRSSDYFSDISTSFLSYVSDDLSSALTKTEDETDNSYSTSSQSYDGFNYMVYKIDQVANPDKFVDETDESLIVDNDIRDAIIAKLKDEKLTDSYISGKIEDEVSDAKISIYDTVLEIQYSLDHDDYSRTRSSAPTVDNDTVLAQITLGDTKVQLLTSEVYKELDASKGPSTALSLLENKLIKTTSTYNDLSSEEKTYKDNLTNMFEAFAQDQYSSYGYSSSMGKYNFMLLFFHEDNVDDIINNYFRVSAAENKLLNDYNTNEKLITDIFVDYAKQAYDKYFKMSASDLLVYADRDEDGNPDVDFDWDTAVNGQVPSDLAKELIEKVNTLVSHSTSDAATALTEIVDEFNSSSRFENDTNENNPTLPETTWAKYRRAGLYIKINTLTDITNTSTEDTVESSVQKVMHDIYNASDFNIGNTFPDEYIYSNGSEHSFSSENGFNYLVVTQATAPASAKFEDDDESSLYNNIPVIFNDKTEIIPNLLNDNNYANENQIKLYLYRYISANATDLTPTDVTTALEAFVKPVYTRYSGEVSHVAHIINFIDNNEDFNGSVAYDSSVAEHAKKLSEINQLTLDSYQNDDELSNIFVGWWDTLNTLYGGTK